MPPRTKIAPLKRWSIETTAGVGWRILTRLRYTGRGVRGSRPGSPLSDICVPVGVGDRSTGIALSAEGAALRAVGGSVARIRRKRHRQSFVVGPLPPAPGAVRGPCTNRAQTKLYRVSSASHQRRRRAGTVTRARSDNSGGACCTSLAAIRPGARRRSASGARRQAADRRREPSRLRRWSHRRRSP